MAAWRNALSFNRSGVNGSDGATGGGGESSEAETSAIMSDADLDANISDTDAKFKKACQQLILLNNQIEAIQARYDRASRRSCRTARYNYRIKLCVVEGVRNMFYEYALRLADQIDDLRRQAGMIVLREDSDESMEINEEGDDGPDDDDIAVVDVEGVWSDDALNDSEVDALEAEFFRQAAARNSTPTPGSQNHNNN